MASFVIIDEVHKVFPTRSGKDKVPPFIVEFAEHRHKGLDFLVTSPNILMIDVFFRRLVDVHFHFIRQFGRASSSVFRFDGCEDAADKKQGRVGAVKEVRSMDPAVFPLYKSAEVHTIKRKIPKKVIFYLLLFLGLLSAAIFLLYFVINERITPSDDPPSDLPSLVSSAPPLEITQAQLSLYSLLPDSAAFLVSFYQVTPPGVSRPSGFPFYDYFVLSWPDVNLLLSSTDLLQLGFRVSLLSFCTAQIRIPGTPFLRLATCPPPPAVESEDDGASGDEATGSTDQVDDSS